jgi:hypothetical protein
LELTSAGMLASNTTREAPATSACVIHHIASVRHLPTGGLVVLAIPPGNAPAGAGGVTRNAAGSLAGIGSWFTHTCLLNGLWLVSGGAGTAVVVDAGGSRALERAMSKSTILRQVAEHEPEDGPYVTATASSLYRRLASMGGYLFCFRTHALVRGRSSDCSLSLKQSPDL